MTSKNFKQSMVNQDQEIIFEVVKESGSWVFPAASSIVEATRGKNMYLRLTDDGRSDIFRLDSVKDGENAGETVFGFVGNGGMDLVELTATTDGTGTTTGSWDYEPGEGPAGEAIGNLGQPIQWKGPATVAQLNAGITGIQPGWTYTLTDAGTLTDGSVAVEAGDEVAWTEDGEWFQVGPSLVELKADVVQAKSDIADIQDVVPEEASESNKLVTKDELDNVQESIQSGFTPKGEISVSDLNDLTTQSNGDQYILTDSGTITDGSVTVEAGDSVAWNSTDSVWYKVKQYALSKYGTDEIKNLQTSITAFRTGDVIPVDGPSGTAKMSKDDLLKETAQNALAGFAKFTDSDKVNQIIRELYIPAGVIADLTIVKFVRMYNGFGGLYGVQLEGAGGTLLLDLRTSTKSNPHLNSGAGAVVNYDLITGNYERIECNLNTDVRDLAFSPSIKAYMLNEQMKSVVTLFTDNAFLNGVVKELYIPSSVLSDAQINSIDNYVLFRSGSYWGVVFKASSSTVLSLLSRQNLGSGVYASNGAYARYNLPTDGTSNLTGNAHLVLSKVRGVENSPAIYTYLLEQEVLASPWYENSQIVQDLSALNNQRAVVYQGDTKSDSNYVVNAVAYPDGSMIVCRRGGVVAKVATDGTETTLLTINNASDWRLCWMDKDLNVYVSPHSSVDNGGSNIDVSARGLYKLAYGESTFTKVINLYDPDSEVTTETQNNDDCIWTMCQDSEGNLYAGVYAHTIRANAGIYKSTDGGDTWTYIYNFVTSGDAPSGRHIHVIICNPYDNCLYVIVGEINQIFKSADGGSTWTKTNWTLEKYKGTMLFPVPDGIIAGSDGAYECIMSKIYSDGRVRTTSKTWAGTVFAFRKSDVSGAIYAFTKIDSSVSSTDYFPPVAAISDPSALQTWLDENHSNKADWQAYNAFIAPRFPEDAIRPQHCAIYVSYDSGETWSIFKRFNVTSAGAFGFWTTGQFRNGECLTGYVGSSYAFVRPLVVTEGKHKFGSSGLDLEGDIFVKLNSSSVVTQL